MTVPNNHYCAKMKTQNNPNKKRFRLHKTSFFLKHKRRKTDNGDTLRSFHLNRGKKYVLRLSKIVEKALEKLLRRRKL